MSTKREPIETAAIQKKIDKLKEKYSARDFMDKNYHRCKKIIFYVPETNRFYGFDNIPYEYFSFINNGGTNLLNIDNAQEFNMFKLNKWFWSNILFDENDINEFKKNNEPKVREYINKSLEFVFFLGVPIMFGLIGIADTLVPWLLGEEFIPVIKTIQLLSPIVLALCITNVIGDQYLMAVNNTKVLTLSYIMGVIINFILNYILIPEYSYIGATISMIITEICIILIQIMKTKNIINFKTIISKMLKYGVASIIMLIIVKILKNININIMLVTFVQIFVGIGVYAIILLILKDEYLLYTTNKFKSMLKKIKYNS